jgi:acyl-CoA reductase-like NAD-dependent aldehyde dehydrogenase
VRSAAARLRAAGEALRARPRGERLALLGRLLEQLRDPTSALREHLAEELPAATGFHPATLAAGLDAGFGAWTARALAELAARELEASPQRIASGFPLTAVVLGGAIPMPSVLQIVAPLALGSPVLVRPGAHDPVTARAVARQLARLDPSVGACVEVVSFPHADAEALGALAEADCVVATGSDAAVAAIGARVQPWQRFVGYGHRFSVAVLARGADLGPACAALARDVALWDQAGCLSPTALYALGWRWEERGELLDRLANEFAEIERRFPIGRVALAEAASRAAEVGTAELRAAASDGADLRRDRAGRWALLAERDPGHRGSPGSRVLRVHVAASLEAVCDALAPVARHLAAIGVAGIAEGAAVSALTRLRPSRICPLGSMQAPPISWCHDGQGVLLPLAVLTDLEPMRDGD